MRNFARHLLPLLLLAIPVLGGDFWEEKRYSQWSEDEVQRLLTDSPWAKTQTVKSVGQVVVRWSSAEPVQMAIARRDQGIRSVPSAPSKSQYYIITVAGDFGKLLPKDAPERREVLMSAATLKPSGKAPLSPDGVSVNGREIEFRFAKMETFGEDTPAADFNLRLGAVKVRQRFQVPLMSLHGQPAL